MLVAPVALAAAVGVALGPLLEAVIRRVPRAESVVRRQPCCPACRIRIRLRDRVPLVSYIASRGRCRSCGAATGMRRPLVEAATGALFAGGTAWAIQSGRPAMLPALLYLIAVGVALAAIDIDVHRLPDALVLPSYGVLAALLAGASLVTGDWGAWARAAVGGAALFAFYLLLVSIRPSGMGWGDVKLSGLVGGAVAYVGWSELVVGAFAGFVLGAVVAVGMIVSRRATAATPLPFGPFMLAGTAVGMVAGGGLGSSYWGAWGV